MEAKLKSISGLIPWSLPLKALIFAASWLILPFWLFAIISLLLFLVPWFQPQRLAVPFVVSLVLAALVEPNIWLAIFFGLIFFYIFGIKDLVFVDRSNAFSLLIFVILFLSIFFHFSKFDEGISFASFGSTVLLVVLALALQRNQSLYAKSEVVSPDTYRGLSILLLLEFALVVLFLPLNFFGQAEILFLVAIALFEMSGDYIAGKMSARLGLIYFSLVFSALVIVLAFAEFHI